MQEATLEYMFNYAFWLAGALVGLGFTARVLHKIFDGSYATPNPSTGKQVTHASRGRAQRQAERAAYLERLARRQIEPEGYVADHSTTAEPDWVQPVYSTGTTYEQPPKQWTNRLQE